MLQPRHETPGLLQREAMRNLQINPSRWLHINLSWQKGKSPWPAIEEIGRSRGVVTYRVSTAIGATYVSEGGRILSHSVRLVEIVTVAQIRERWYLAALPWGENPE